VQEDGGRKCSMPLGGKSTANKVLGLWGGRACPMGLFKQSGVAKKGRSAASEEGGEEEVW